MKSNKIKKIVFLLVFSILVSLISFNTTWAESKTFHFVLNNQGDWRYTLGEPATGSFTVDVSVGGPTEPTLEYFNIERNFLFVEMMYTPHVWVHFINGVPSTSISYFELRGKEIGDGNSRRLEMVQEMGGLSSGNYWCLYQYAGQSSEGEDLWEQTGQQGNWFFVSKEDVDWSGAPSTVEISSYVDRIAPNVNNMVDFTPIGRPWTGLFTNDFPPSRYGCPDTYVGLFAFQAVLKNTSNTSLTDLIVKVHTLTKDNLLVLARGNNWPKDFGAAETGGEGVHWTLPKCGYYDGRTLDPGPRKVATPVLAICLKEMRKFDFYVDVLGTVR